MRSSFSAPMVLPCLLQTEDHAQAITDATGFVRRDHSERFVSFRLARAQRLTDGTPLELTAVINEAALRLNLGKPEVRQTQYRHLLKLAKLPNVSIQLLRPEDGPHTAGTGGFCFSTSTGRGRSPTASTSMEQSRYRTRMMFARRKRP